MEPFRPDRLLCRYFFIKAIAALAFSEAMSALPALHAASASFTRLEAFFRSAPRVAEAV